MLSSHSSHRLQLELWVLTTPENQPLRFKEFCLLIKINTPLVVCTFSQSFYEEPSGMTLTYVYLGNLIHCIVQHGPCRSFTNSGPDWHLAMCPEEEAMHSCTAQEQSADQIVTLLHHSVVPASLLVYGGGNGSLPFSWHRLLLPLHCCS